MKKVRKYDVYDHGQYMESFNFEAGLPMEMARRHIIKIRGYDSDIIIREDRQSKEHYDI